jgi:holo-[acyl-carrier protein] synthase
MMPPLACGIDILEIERMTAAIQRHGERLLQRVFTPGELADVGQNPASLAARFAAKEAVAKALGTGIGEIAWREIEIRRGPDKQPILYLYGDAARLATDLKLTHWAISLSHSHSHAIAMAVATGE